MWTGPKTISNRMWRPNHFVPIINGSINEESVVNVSDTGSESGTFEFNDMESDSNINAENCETAEVLTSLSELTDTESDRICKLSESFTEEGSDDQILDVTEISVSHPYQNPTENGINNFLNTEEQYCLVKNSQAVDLTCIPRGIKENVFFLINDRQNVERRNLGKKSEYPDDCGAWDGAKSSTKTEYFIKQNSKLRMIKRRTDGTYFVIAKKEEIALSPQPSSDEVIIVKRLYSKLNRDPSYKRRIIYFVSGISPDVAVVEYLGSYPKNVPHGNSLNNSARYRRVNSKQKALIKNELEKGSLPREIKEIVRTEMPDDGISLKTAENARYLHNKGKDPSAKQNLADEVLSVFNMCYDQTFIKEVIFSNPSKPPSVICYSDEQMLSLKSSLSNGGILGIDRTFNLGACYVTTLTFKNKNIIRTTSGEPPIMLGPVYLHWEGSFQSYHRFLSHIQSRFSDIDTSKIVFGSDGEKAVINAISDCFPNSTHTLCTRHLKENLAHQLRKEMTMENATSIVNKIFNRETGPVDDEITYNEMEDEVIDKCTNTYIVNYLDKIKEYVFKARQKASFIPKFWTNNNNESLNNIIKLKTDWKVQKLPKLKEKLHELDITQTRNLRDALHHRGDFKLAPNTQSLVVSDEIWLAMSAEQRQRRLLRLLNYKNLTDSNMIWASNADFKVPSVSNVAKKPGQTKRVKSCKTRSIKIQKTA